jgi:N-acetylneuraminate epimerase
MRTNSGAGADRCRLRNRPRCGLILCGLFTLVFARVALLSAGGAEMRWSTFSPLPNSEGFAGSFAGVSGDALLVAGGANFPGKKPWEGGAKRWYDTVFVLETPDGAWRIAGKLPRPLGYGVSITTAGGLLWAGGSDAQRHYNDVFLLRWKDGKLHHQKIPSLPEPCANMCGGLIENIAYIAGGTRSPTATTALRNFWTLDLSAKQPRWQRLDAWPGPPRMLAVAGVSAGAFYLFSGVDLQPGADGKPVRSYLRDAYCYWPPTGWRRLPDLPRSAAAAPSPAPLVDGALLVMSGDDGSKTGFQPMAAHPGFERTSLAFDLQSQQWRAGADVPFSRATAPTVSWRRRWIIPSGEVRPGVRAPEVWTLTPVGH